MLYLRLMRPQQWSKNVFLFAGLIFGQRITHLPSVIAVLLAFACFCLVSSAIYVFNDIHDRNEDRLHPQKKDRPIASGRISVSSAAALDAVLIVLGLGGAWLLSPGFFLVAATYALLQICYTFWLKHVVLLDVILIGIGFVLRAVVGVVVLVDIKFSPWLVLCTFTLCLFMGFSKRRCELAALTQPHTKAARHRKTLAEYTPDLLNHMTTLTAGIAVVSFMLYAMDKRTISEFGTNYLLYTLPLVVYAIFRFALLVEHERVSGPTQVMMHDRPFQAALILWVISASIIVYRGRELQTWLYSLLDHGAANGLAP